MSISQAVKSDLLLYAYDTCLMYQHNDIAEIDKILNEDFENTCDWFIYNISIHFGDDKTKSVLFVSKGRIKNIRKLNTKFKEIDTKQQAQVAYLGFALYESTSAEPMPLKIINKINGKLKFLFRKNTFFNTRTT